MEEEEKEESGSVFRLAISQRRHLWRLFELHSSAYYVAIENIQMIEIHNIHQLINEII